MSYETALAAWVRQRTLSSGPAGPSPDPFTETRTPQRTPGVIEPVLAIDLAMIRAEAQQRRAAAFGRVAMAAWTGLRLPRRSVGPVAY